VNCAGCQLGLLGISGRDSEDGSVLAMSWNSAAPDVDLSWQQ